MCSVLICSLITLLTLDAMIIALGSAVALEAGASLELVLYFIMFSLLATSAKVKSLFLLREDSKLSSSEKWIHRLGDRERYKKDEGEDNDSEGCIENGYKNENLETEDDNEVEKDSIVGINEVDVEIGIVEGKEEKE